MTPSYNNLTFMRGTFLFSGDNGQWQKLEDSKNRLMALLHRSVSAHPLALEHPHFSNADMRELLMGKDSLDCEFGEGPEYAVATYLRNDSHRESMEQAVGMVIKSFQGPSELSRHALAGKMGLEKENKSQAMARLPRNILDWLDANRREIPEETADAIRAETKIYCDNLHYVQDYVKNASTYLNKLVEQGRG